MKVVEVSVAQKRAATHLITMLERDGEPVRDWTRKVAAAKPRPAHVDPTLEASDAVVLYLV